MAHKRLLKCTKKRKVPALPAEPSPVRADFHLYFEAGFEDKVFRFLRSDSSTRKAFSLIPDEPYSRILVLLLCNVVFYGEQSKTNADELINERTGTKAANVENFPAQIERFCQKLWLCLKTNYDLRSDNTPALKEVIPTLLRIADTIGISTREAKFDAAHWRTGWTDALCTLADFMRDRTEQDRFPSLSKLLNGTARALGLTPTYSERNIREIVQYHRRVRKADK